MWGLFLSFIFVSVSGMSGHSIVRRDLAESSNFKLELLSNLQNYLGEGEDNYCKGMENYEATFGGVWLSGSMKATNGKICDLSTLEILDLAIDPTPDSLNISVAIKLGYLTVTYMVEVMTSFYSTKGNVSATVGDHKLDIGLLIVIGDDFCEASLNDFRFQLLSDLNVVFSDEDGLMNNTIMKKLLGNLVKKHKDKFISKSIERIKVDINDKLPKLCDYFM